MEKNLVRLFEKVQRIPYRVCKFEKDKIDENLAYGDCRHKSELLSKFLQKEGYEVKRVKVLFDWKDLPLPKKLLYILQGNSILDHDSLSININGKWTRVDCTWNPELLKLGFPVTVNWDGKSDTKQVTDGKLEFFDAKNYIKGVKIERKIALKFADGLNKWLANQQ